MLEKGEDKYKLFLLMVLLKLRGLDTVEKIKSLINVYNCLKAEERVKKGIKGFSSLDFMGCSGKKMESLNPSMSGISQKCSKGYGCCWLI